MEHLLSGFLCFCDLNKYYSVTCLYISGLCIQVFVVTAMFDIGEFNC